MLICKFHDDKSTIRAAFRLNIDPPISGVGQGTQATSYPKQYEWGGGPRERNEDPKG